MLQLFDLNILYKSNDLVISDREHHSGPTLQQCQRGQGRSLTEGIFDKAKESGNMKTI